MEIENFELIIFHNLGVHFVCWKLFELELINFTQSLNSAKITDFKLFSVFQKFLQKTKCTLVSCTNLIFWLFEVNSLVIV